MKNKILLLVSILTMTLSIIDSAIAASKANGIYMGGSITDDSSYEFLGGVRALNSDLKKDGFLIRVGAGLGKYKYSYDTNSATQKFKGDILSGEAAVGYQKYFDTGRATFYLGGNYENHEVFPKDVDNKVTGGQAGVKSQFELTLTPYKNLVINHISSYSNAFHSYFNDNMIGWDFGLVTFGPEAIFLGGESFDQQRYGASFSNIDIAGIAKLRLSSGFARASRRADNSFYASVNLASEF